MSKRRLTDGQLKRMDKERLLKSQKGEKTQVPCIEGSLSEPGQRKRFKEGHGDKGRDIDKLPKPKKVIFR